MGSAPFVGGGFGHFYHYAPEKLQYPIDRYTMETKRQLDLLNQLLAARPFIAGEHYSIADMAIWPWYGQLVQGRLYSSPEFDAAQFLAVQQYPHVQAWAERIWQRPAVQRGWKVNRNWGDPADQVPERHSAADFQR
jgi:GST-like protein